mmetsp:Transcript_6914/g.14399  ORF Transcript_6914/g.14399 Transcript_6914/m.14399 type:complete len:110 (-) Transcript_6914:110-439(-)
MLCRNFLYFYLMMSCLSRSEMLRSDTEIHPTTPSQSKNGGTIGQIDQGSAPIRVGLVVEGFEVYFQSTVSLALFYRNYNTIHLLKLFCKNCTYDFHGKQQILFYRKWPN